MADFRAPKRRKSVIAVQPLVEIGDGLLGFKGFYLLFFSAGLVIVLGTRARAIPNKQSLDI